MYNSAQFDFGPQETVARARLGSKAFRWHCFGDLYPPNVREKKVVVSSLFGNYPVNGEVPALAVTISGIHVHNERDRAQGDRGSQGGRKSVRRTNRIVLPASSAHIRFFYDFVSDTRHKMTRAADSSTDEERSSGTNAA